MYHELLNTNLHGAFYTMRTAAYLASDASAFHTGDILVIDGGRMVK
jgi:NAD(P)-dependent dehydrogenase (short-subunit alcohol dehydrogenase family)